MCTSCPVADLPKRLGLERDRRHILPEPGLLPTPALLPAPPRHGGLSPIALSARCCLVLQERFDLIHGFAHRPAVSLPALLGRRRWRVPYVADWADLRGGGG